MAEPVDTVNKFLTDNRTAIGGKDSAGTRVAILPTLPNGLAFVAKSEAGADITGETPANATTPAYIASATVGSVIVPIDYATRTGGATGGSKYVRTANFSYFNVVTGTMTKKLCYVNSTGWPLTSAGAKAKNDLSDAADATTTQLSAVGEAVTNYAQPGPLPGTYTVTERQQGYSPYLGWVAKP